MTGWQLTANRIISAPWSRHSWQQLADVVLVWLVAMVCGNGWRRQRFARNKQKIQYQTSCLQYLHMANISDGNTDINHSSLFRGQRLFCFYCRLPSNCLLYSKTFIFLLSSYVIRAQKYHFNHILCHKYLINISVNNSCWRILFIMRTLKL